MSELYSHRNGEIEPPTMKGHFWEREKGNVGNVVHVIWQPEFHYRGRVDVRAGWIISGEIDVYVDELVDVQWWGPLVPPWETE